MTKRIMNWLRGKISKTLLLLAAVMLPVHQTLAANCCCRRGHDASHTQMAGSHGDCCTTMQRSCCGGGNSGSDSCCQGGESESGSKPCNCPAGCCGKIPPDVIDPVTVEVITVDDLVTVANVAPNATLVDGINSAHLVSKTSSSSLGGSQLCVLLCVYRL